jgi:hypothetical protein
MRKVLLMSLMAFCLVVRTVAQSPLSYLNTVYPQLTELFRDELDKYPAHYIFAVDVSGTMNKYSDDVSTALAPFFQALPNNDRVDVIPFGTDAVINMLNYCGVINPQIRTALCTNISNLYSDPSYPQGFKGYTDIPKAIDAIAKVIQNNREYKVNVIIILTDFRNDEMGDTPSEHKISKADIAVMHDAIAAATNDVYTRCVALELPVNKNMPGYCLDQLKNEVFPQEVNGLEIVPLTNPGVMIGQWFEQLKRDIMVTKLKAVIANANKTTPVTLKTETDIDGNVVAEVHWTPGKLYPAMEIDSTFMDGEDFYFENNTASFTKTLDSVIVVELGQIKHKEYGLHHLVDSINLGLNLPTPYDKELFTLGIKKPLPNTKKAEDRWVWTFFLSFWTTVTILALIILYIIGVIKAIARNNKLCFKGNITFYDALGNQVGDTVRLPKQNSSARLIFGSGGTPRCKVDDAEWQFVIEKKKGNPFLLFVKPCFEWRCTRKHVASGKNRSGKMNYGSASMMRVKCGESRNELTHGVKVQLIK